MARVLKFVKLLSHVIFIFFISLFLTQKSLNPVTVRRINRFLPDLKHLLIWTKIHGINDDGQKHFIDRKCHYINCYFTRNRSFFGDTRYFDAIIFNLQDVSEYNYDLPRMRGVNQKYIFAANDSSDNYPVCNPVFDNYFNWTWTYRPDSTIPYRFISIYNSHGDELGSHFKWTSNMKEIDRTLKSELASKSKVAVIFLNKCKTRSKRENFLNNLQIQLAKYNLTIDVYGKCGTIECRRKTMHPCLWKIKKLYYFYLALEDSFSADYITKSILYGYNYNAVPIVFGKAEYERYLPPNSYLDGLKLGEEKLARAMWLIMNDPSRYYELFRWRNHYVIKESNILDACTLCETMNNPSWLVHRVSYSQFRVWWNPSFKERCGSMRQLVVI